MLSLPAYILLIPFGAFLLAFAFFSLVNIANLAKYGARNFVGFLVSFLFVSGAAIILFLTWQTVGGTDWMASVPIIDTPYSLPTVTF